MTKNKMKRPTSINTIPMYALLAVMVAGQAMAANIRYKNSGDYFDTTNMTANAWGWQSGYVPMEEDVARLNWGGSVGNTVILSSEAPWILNFQFGVDESGHLIVTNGGKLTATGAVGGSTVGNNGNAGVVGRLTVTTGGEVLAKTSAMRVGHQARGIVTLDGGALTTESHLWVGSSSDPDSFGTNYIRNDGVLSVGQMIGLGTINSTAPSGGYGFIFVQTNGTLNLANIQAAAATNLDGSINPAYLGSIQPGSRIDITDNGLVTIRGDFVNVMNNYIGAGRITAYGGLGTVEVNLEDDGMGTLSTRLTAIAPTLPTDVVWDPASNPSTTGNWNESANWTGFVVPADVTKVTFNVPDAIPCTVTSAAVARQVVMGDDGPGGTLIITNGGSLACGADAWSAIGYNNNAVMSVEDGGSASFGTHLWIGFDPGSDGTLNLSGGSVSVSGMVGLGWNGGTGTVNVNGGSLNLAQFDATSSIQGASVLNVTGTGMVVITGNHLDSVNNYVSSGRITADGGAGTVVVNYNNLRLGKTTIYALGATIIPEQTVWNPTANFPDVDGLWSSGGNWAGGQAPGSLTKAMFNVPDAIPCFVTDAAVADRIVIGDNGPGGTLIIRNGGSLVCSSPDEWSAIGYNNNGLLIVENGGSASFAYHLWIGHQSGVIGTLTMNGGTFSVNQMFGLGWSGGTGYANIHGGTLNLTQWNDTDSIKGASVLDVAGMGRVIINGDRTVSVGNFVNSGKITAGGTANVVYSYDPDTGKTTITSGEPLPPPSQSITSVAVTGGNVSVTYQATAGYAYYIEETPGLSPATWSPVPGSTNTAPGASVTFTFPAGSGPMFYRTVSP
jgi:hypothetical protein